MLHTYRGKVEEDGTIRLQEEVDLPTGGEVLVTFLDKDAFISLMVSTGVYAATRRSGSGQRWKRDELLDLRSLQRICCRNSASFPSPTCPKSQFVRPAGRISKRRLGGIWVLGQLTTQPFRRYAWQLS